MLFFNNIYSAECIMQHLVVWGLFDDPVKISDYLALFVK